METKKVKRVYHRVGLILFNGSSFRMKEVFRSVCRQTIQWYALYLSSVYEDDSDIVVFVQDVAGF